MIHIKILTIPEHPFTADTHLMYKKKINKTTSNHVGLPVGHNNVNHNFTILCMHTKSMLVILAVLYLDPP